MSVDRIALFRALHGALEGGRVLHGEDDGHPLTAGRVAVPGGEARWSLLIWPRAGEGRGGEPEEDDCGSVPALARAWVARVGARRAAEWLGL